MKYCGNCGKPMDDDQIFCAACGTKAGNTGTQNNAVPQNSQNTQNIYNPSGKADAKNMPAFILGLIGAIFALFGGICVSACYGVTGNDTAPMILMIGGSLVGLIGACMCFKNAKTGSALEIAAAVMIAICAFGITGADIMSLMGMAMLGIGGVFGLLSTLSNNK